ncbi:ATP-binding protein [Hyalangium versicolor]|uniref:ATP-binding protein n=1 Tax=Hyalangium versicolor TaxID=2861190 RepID=UPI001CCC382A|nr:ATP-binding protein [Hyalangium versicolor]
MREPSLNIESRFPGGIPPGTRLARETGIFAGRLAQLLGGALPSENPLSRQRELLEQIFRTTAGERPLADWEGSTLDRMEDPPHPLDRLAIALRLAPVEVDLLVLAGVPEQHEGLCAVLRSLHPRSEPWMSVGLAAQLLCRSNAERLLLREVLETGAMVRAGVLRLTGDAPFFERSLVPAESLWAALHEHDVWPTGILPREAPATVSGLEGWLATPNARLAIRTLQTGEPRTVLVAADSEDVALPRAAALTAAASVPSANLAAAGPWTPELVRLACLHSLARGVTPVLRLSSPEGSSTVEVPSFDGFPGPVVIAGREGATAIRGLRPAQTLYVDRPSPTARAQAWGELLPELASVSHVLATRYSLEPATVREVAQDVRSAAQLEGSAPGLAHVAASVRTRTGLSLTPSVKLIQPTAQWENLVLSPDRLSQLREAVDRLGHQQKVLDEWRLLAGRPGARGVRVLFAGPPGTGKTLSAEVLASALGVDLLLVDISRLVSKWIGETEKNLSAVFDAAEHTQAVLLFDEADGLFGRRSEVSDAHDRYANLETAYLLSRLERFEGLAILSTNLRNNIDPAFIRRLEFVVDFDEPTHEERLALWRCHLPSQVPLATEVDLAELAALYPISGGLIRNAAVAAAFLAAAQATPITRHHLVRAVWREYAKSGRAFPGIPAGVAEP